MSKKTTKSPKDNAETPEDKMKARFESLKRSHEKIKLTRRPLYRAIIVAFNLIALFISLGCFIDVFCFPLRETFVPAGVVYAFSKFC